MTLDLTNEQHRGALRWACERARDLKAFAHLLAYGDAGTREQREAATALSSPSQSAALVRALLEGRGVVATIGHPFDVRIDDSAAAADVHVMHASGAVGVRIREEDHQYRWFENLPALILRLLDATDRDGALAALRGAS